MNNTMAAWPLTSLAQILAPISRPAPVEPLKTYPLLGMHWYAEGLYIKERKPGSQIQATILYQVKAGDFVYNRLFAWKGAFGIADADTADCYVSNEFPCFRVDETRAFPAFLLKYYSQSSIWQEAQESSSGTTPTSRLRLKVEQLLAMQIPLPPLDEQRRIVARIDALAARIEEARGLRRQAGEETEALEGATRNKLFDPHENASWPVMTLGEVADIRSGVTLGRTVIGETIPVPYLRVANVQDGYLDLDVIKEIAILASELDKWHLEPGDVLLTEGGDWDKLGRGTVWRGEIPLCIHQNHIFRVRANPNQFVPDFLAALIGSPYGKEYFQGASKQTTNLASINQTQLKAFRVFCPPLAEQRRIVAYLDDLQARADALRRLQAETAADLEALLPAVLDQAFRGEL